MSDSSNILVRDAVVADVDAVLPMVRGQYELHAAWEPGKYTLRADPAESYRPWLEKRVADPRSVFLVAEAEALPGVVGFVVATVERDLPIYRVVEHGFIHDLWVVQDARGAGAGRALVEETLRRFHAMGVHQVRLETAWKNDAARRLFTRLGFHEAAVTMVRDGERGDGP